MPGLYELAQYAFLADRNGGQGLTWAKLADPGNDMVHMVSHQGEVGGKSWQRAAARAQQRGGNRVGMLPWAWTALDNTPWLLFASLTPRCSHPVLGPHSGPSWQ